MLDTRSVPTFMAGPLIIMAGPLIVMAGLDPAIHPRPVPHTLPAAPVKDST